MACNCRDEVTESLLSAWKLKTPFASGHLITLDGYIPLGKNPKLSTLEKAQMMIYKYCVFSDKSGNIISRHKKNHLIFTYCPFCGVKYDPDESK
jgi:hypothetical protein